MIHLAGFHVVLCGRLRQRCAWCGALLVDTELPEDVLGELSAQQLSADWWMRGHGVMPAGRFVVEKRNGRWVEHAWSPAEPMPPSSCALVDSDITAL